MTKIIDGIITNLSETDNLDPDDAALVATNGTAPPATTPVYIGQFYVDTSARKLYFSVGTSSAADWEPAN